MMVSLMPYIEKWHVENNAEKLHLLVWLITQKVQIPNLASYFMLPFLKYTYILFVWCLTVNLMTLIADYT